jgi:uroporphyrinogen decarboxylase
VNDRFLRACRQEPVDVTPVWFMRQAGRSLPEYRRIRERATLQDIIRDPALCAEVTLQPVNRLGVDAAILFADITTPLPGIGVEVQIADGVGPLIAAPIRSRVQIDRLHPFDSAEAVGGLLEAIRLLRRELQVPLIGFAGAPFTLASYLVGGRSAPGVTRLKELMSADPATFDALMRRLVDMTVDYLCAQVAAGVQAVQIFDSWVGALSPFDYERSVEPHMRRLFSGLAEAIDVPVIHFGTASAGLLGAMARAGGSVIGVDWRIGLADAWARVPGRAIQGNLDPAAMLRPWDDAADQARWLITQAAGRPGHIFNLGHGVLPETDPDSLRRLVELVHEATIAVPVP